MVAAPARIQTTIVFQKNWSALSALSEDGSHKYKYVVNSGSSRSSKTHSLIQLFYLYALNNPRKKLAVFRGTKKACIDTVLDDMLKIYPDMPGYSELVSFNITKGIFTFANGSTIHIEGTDDAIKVHGYHSDLLWFNEAYDISEETFKQLKMRCKGQVIFDLNPRQKHWIYENVLVKDDALLIHSTFRDNPLCPPDQRESVLSYQPISKCDIVLSKLLTETQARSYDLEANPKGFTPKQIRELDRCRYNEDTHSADAFDWEVYGLGLKGERKNRIFRFNEISDEAYNKIDRPIYYGVDWGTVDPWGILEAKYADGALYFRELNYASENEIRKDLTTTERNQIDGQEEGIVLWMFRKLGMDHKRDVICDNNRLAKVQALRNHSEYTQTYLALKLAGSIIDGIDILKNMPVYYTRSSTNFAYEQENYSRKVDRSGEVLEEPEDLNNHLMDPARYIALHLHRAGIIRKV